MPFADMNCLPAEEQPAQAAVALRTSLFPGCSMLSMRNSRDDLPAGKGVLSVGPGEDRRRGAFPLNFANNFPPRDCNINK